MPKRQRQEQVLEIEGFGSVTIRALSSREYWALAREYGDNYSLGVALLIQHGVVKPEFTEWGRLEGNDDAINDIANAILELTKPNVLADDRDNDVKRSIRARYGDR